MYKHIDLRYIVLDLEKILNKDINESINSACSTVLIKHYGDRNNWQVIKEFLKTNSEAVVIPFLKALKTYAQDLGYGQKRIDLENILNELKNFLDNKNDNIRTEASTCLEYLTTDTKGINEATGIVLDRIESEKNDLVLERYTYILSKAVENRIDISKAYQIIKELITNKNNNIRRNVSYVLNQLAGNEVDMSNIVGEIKKQFIIEKNDSVARNFILTLSLIQTKIDISSSIKTIKKYLQNRSNLDAVVWALGRYYSNVNDSNGLLELIKSKDGTVVEKILGYLTNGQIFLSDETAEKVASSIIKLLTNKNENVAYNSCLFLLTLGSGRLPKQKFPKETIEKIGKMLINNREEVRESASKILWYSRIDPSKIIKYIKKALANSKNRDVIKNNMLIGLYFAAQNGTTISKLKPELKKCLLTRNQQLKLYAVRLFEFLRLDSKDILFIKTCLKGDDVEIKKEAASILAKYYDRKNKFREIVKLLNHKDGDVRYAASNQIEKNSNKKVISYLLPKMVVHLKDQNKDVRASIALTLANYAEKGQDLSKYLNLLVDNLSDEYDVSRDYITMAIMNAAEKGAKVDKYFEQFKSALERELDQWSTGPRTYLAYTFGYMARNGTDISKVVPTLKNLLNDTASYAAANALRYAAKKTDLKPYITDMIKKLEENKTMKSEKEDLLIAILITYLNKKENGKIREILKKTDYEEFIKNIKKNNKELRKEIKKFQ